MSAVSGWAILFWRQFAPGQAPSSLLGASGTAAVLRAKPLAASLALRTATPVTGALAHAATLSGAAAIAGTLAYAATLSGTATVAGTLADTLAASAASAVTRSLTETLAASAAATVAQALTVTRPLADVVTDAVAIRVNEARALGFLHFFSHCRHIGHQTQCRRERQSEIQFPSHSTPPFLSCATRSKPLQRVPCPSTVPAIAASRVANPMPTKSPVLGDSLRKNGGKTR